MTQERAVAAYQCTIDGDVAQIRSMPRLRCNPTPARTTLTHQASGRPTSRRGQPDAGAGREYLATAADESTEVGVLRIASTAPPAQGRAASSRNPAGSWRNVLGELWRSCCPPGGNAGTISKTFFNPVARLSGSRVEPTRERRNVVEAHQRIWCEAVARSDRVADS